MVVVMDSIPGRDLAFMMTDRLSGSDKLVPETVLSDVRAALKALHQKGFVFGDLRPPNVVLCDRQASDGTTVLGVLLVDFDWSGPQGQQRYPSSLNDSVEWPQGAEPYGIIAFAHDLAMLERLESLEGTKTSSG